MTDKPDTARPVAIAQDANVSKQEALDQWQQEIAYTEAVYNGAVIRWRYWVEQMPQLRAAEAARLMCALDPDLFQSLDHRPNKNDPSKRCEQAAVIQRLAERQGMQVATPAQWLAWAIQEGFVVHDGFRLAVESQPAPAQDTATPAPVVTGASGDAKPANSKPAKTRSDLIAPVIKLAQSRCKDPSDTAEVWAHMQVLAQEEHPPFLASMKEGLKYHKDGKDKYFTRDALRLRLHPELRAPRK